MLLNGIGVKLSGPGEWLVENHGTRRRRAWRKLHLGIDARTGTIVASTLTSKEVDDAAELGSLLDQVEEPLAAVVADGAYDPGSANGRLLLGLKGTISEVELHTMRGRLTAGLLSKAERG